MSALPIGRQLSRTLIWTVYIRECLRQDSRKLDLGITLLLPEFGLASEPLHAVPSFVANQPDSAAGMVAYCTKVSEQGI